ncbi:polysaccharide deacetylase family protein [Colwellia psychrerythraea]|uniref:Polysaccharide deacetylase n=1 Tax=Colwellia psychrerythraea TaxID=28229 RepID=A0A099KZB1_COLPS|nr:polysaccharide deacetylase family protein [Colwellia psychrerythraea]KGJ94983.1 polysaccharide deacetylase [Colwellia psychrerythraea]
MWFLAQTFQRYKRLITGHSLGLVAGVVMFSILLSGCGDSSSTPVDITVGTGGIVTQSTIIQTNFTQSINSTDEVYKLITLTGYEQSGLQVYWPNSSNIPVVLQTSLQLIIPQINKTFTQQNFAFSQLSSSGAPALYKKILFSPVSSVNSDEGVEQASFTLVGDGVILVMLNVDALLENSKSNTLLSAELSNIIYQSERIKYQHDNSIFERLVSRGLALHFLKQTLPADEITFSVEIEQSELLAALTQVKSGLEDGVLIENWFDDTSFSEQGTANAVGYYLVSQHFSFYNGSNASNSYSLASSMFLSWLDGENKAIKKPEQYVRTGNVPDQIAIEELARQASLYLGSYFIEGLNHQKLIALSFDDGPSEYTTKILDVLEKAQVPASFFWQGQNLANYQEVVKRSIIAGHTIANHSWDHANGMSYSGEDLWQQQVAKTNDEFLQLFNIMPRFYRPPYGEISDEQIEHLAAKGMKVILWSVDSRDWNPALNSIEKIESELINNQHEEVITLMHDAGGNRQNTVDSLPAIIAHYQAQGYHFVNLETLLGISDKH